MNDQADDLRQLVLRTAASMRGPVAPPPPLIAVAGGKGGAGTTTIAVNLSVALARAGRRVVLVDADLHQPDATRFVGLAATDCITDVLLGTRTVHEVLQPGPVGIQVLPGVRDEKEVPACSSSTQRRMLAELARLGPHADAILIDVGNETDTVTGRFWQAADLIVLVTANDPAAIMDSYAAVKLLGTRHPRPLHVCVNKVPNDAAAADVFARLHQACHRFLDLNPQPLPPVPLDHDLALACRRRRPLAMEKPTSEACRCLDALAEQVVITLEQQAQGRGGEGAATNQYVA